MNSRFTPDPPDPPDASLRRRREGRISFCRARGGWWVGWVHGWVGSFRPSMIVQFVIPGCRDQGAGWSRRCEHAASWSTSRTRPFMKERSPSSRCSPPHVAGRPNSPTIPQPHTHCPRQRSRSRLGPPCPLNAAGQPESLFPPATAYSTRCAPHTYRSRNTHTHARTRSTQHACNAGWHPCWDMSLSARRALQLPRPACGATRRRPSPRPELVHASSKLSHHGAPALPPPPCPAKIWGMGECCCCCPHIACAGALALEHAPLCEHR